jgi:tripartite ATP-independent transporter DctP family solute receptor
MKISLSRSILFSAVICLSLGLLSGCLPSSGSGQTAKPSADSGAQAPVSDSAKGAQSGSADKKIIRANTGVSQADPAARALAEVFKPAVETATNGEYVVEVYHSAQLGADVNAIESLRSGTLEMNFNGTAPLAGMVKELTLLDLPFAFKDSKSLVAVLNGPVGVKLSEELGKNGLVVLAWTDNGIRHLTNSKHPVNTPNDVKGLKIRTQQNKYHMSAWQSFGAAPTPMAISEVFTALQTHTIDGQENPIPTIYTSKFYEVNKFISLTGHVPTPCGLFFSKKIFDSYPANIQKTLIECAQKTVTEHLKLVSQVTVESLEKIKAEGGIINEISPANYKLFQDATKNVWDEVGKNVGPEILNQFREAIQKVN